MTDASNLRGALYMMASMASFTLNDACVKLLADDVPLFQIVFLRGLLTTALMAMTVAAFGRLSFRIPRGDRGRVIWRTVFEVAAMVFFLTALVNMAIANATAILSALPLTVTLAAALVFREPLGWRRLTAVGVGFAGVMMIVQPGTDGFNAYSLFALVAVLLITGREMATRSFSAEVPSSTVAVITAAAVCVFGGVASAFEPWAPIGWREAGLISLASVFIIGGYVFSILVMRVGQVGFTAPFRYTSLVFALVLGLAVFGEWPNALALCGAAVVMGTGIYTLLRERALRRAARHERDGAAHG
ncbi:Membrane protein, putative [Roseibacterium elongatum DSM 19469]|uniref:Membrane protein, putative n=1 Tax=Roseicyclus elongatus DSM 19469 TaxID=1294273 RepID=W8SN61_9RHOB|nr:DMT family transporter [Roseibacterium elongatum]AHM03930.1 Membrane protein, putative [Roseibacterium elongatum DSM 19469]